MNTIISTCDSALLEAQSVLTIFTLWRTVKIVSASANAAASSSGWANGFAARVGSLVARMPGYVSNTENCCR